MKYLLLLISSAILIRLIGIEQSLWLDEATTAQTLKHLSISQIISQFSPTDFHPPLYYIGMKLWTNLFGYSELALRAPSVVFAILTSLVVYLIGKRLRDEHVGLAAMLLFLFNPLVIYYSQEARMYMMAVFFLTTALYGYLIVIETFREKSMVKVPKHSNAQFATIIEVFRRAAHVYSGKGTLGLVVVITNICILLSLYTFYGSIFFIGAMYLYLLLSSVHARRASKKPFMQAYADDPYYIPFMLLIPGALIALVSLAPLLLRQMENASSQLSLVPNWSEVLGKATLKNLFLIPLKFTVGRIQWLPKWCYYLVGGSAAAVMMLLALRGALRERKLLFMMIAPLAFGVVFSFFTPLLQYFRFLYLLPVFALLLALSTNRKPIIMVLVGVFLFFSMKYLLVSEYHREDWRTVVQNLPRKRPVYMIVSSSDPLRYYQDRFGRSDIAVRELKGLTESSAEAEMVIVPYTADIHGVNYRPTVEKNYKLAETVNTRGVWFEIWKRNSR